MHSFIHISAMSQLHRCILFFHNKCLINFGGHQLTIKGSVVIHHWGWLDWNSAP